jgi:predicted nuclease of restriction endonuclease-like (RecB) superfamily
MGNNEKKSNSQDGALVPAAKASELAANANGVIDESVLFERVAVIIENHKDRAAAHANRELTMMFWEIGQYINSILLENQRAEYGKKILPSLAAKLTEKYGKNFSNRNLYRMMLFAERFRDTEILPPLAARLSWSHIIELLPLKSDEARLYYANEAAKSNYGTKELRRQISRKAYERREIANTELSAQTVVPFNVFKDPYLLDMFGLKDNFLEADLEKAILAEIQSFLLEFGHGITFVDRQKRMILDGKDIVLDLLLYSRTLRRLIAIELKLGDFKAAYHGQMLLYLKWLDKYERQPGEEVPIGIILCATASREIVELLEPDKSGIAVAEYWTQLPPKAEFERKIREILTEAQERLERRKLLPGGDVKREIDYFIEPKDDDAE